MFCNIFLTWKQLLPLSLFSAETERCSWRRSRCPFQSGTGPSVLARIFDNHSRDSERKVAQLEPHFLADWGRSRLLHRHLPLCWVSCAVTEDCSAISYLKFALSSCSKGGQYSCCQSVCYHGSVCTQETTEKILIFVTLNIVVAMNNSVNQCIKALQLPFILVRRPVVSDAWSPPYPPEKKLP